MPQHYKSQLAALIKVRGQAGFSEYEVLKIFCDVCESLATLHCSQAPVIYRDVKIENVVQNDMGRFILAESGTATARFLNPMAHGKKVVEEEVQKNTSLPYRAPEMVDLNSGHSITTKVDIWAAGVLLYKLCFGVMPFGESSKAILHCQYNIPEKCKYSPELCQLIRFLLEPDPEKRPNIYQVCELAFKISGKDNPLRIARERQKSLVTSTSNNSTNSAPTDQQYERKFQTAVISGTSVAPRSRPKPQLTGTSAPFTLGPPPLNPSPKNVVSPVPGAMATAAPEVDRAFVANFSENFPKAPGGLGGTKSPAIGGSEVQEAGLRFIPSDSKHLLVPSMESTREKSATVSPASLLLSPFEPPSEPPSSSSSSTRPRPTTLLAATGAPLGKASHRHRQVACVLSNSNSEKSLVSPCSSSTWNPFGDPSPFSPNSTLTEDQLFGAEFDKLRLEGGSQTSIVTSPEEMKSEQAATVPDSWLQQQQQKQQQRFSLPALNQVALDGCIMVEEDPFGSAPFTLPKRLKDKAGRSSRLTSKLSEVISSATSGGTTLWRHSTGGGKESLITVTTPGVSVGENGAVGNGEVDGMLGIKLDDLISGGDKGSPNFIKLPLDDRNKYEKLNSNDVTSDDSDSEFYPDSVGGGLKKQSFKQFVENNIPEKLQAVYHKVDKGQIKNVQIVKKLRGKVVNKDELKRKKEKRVKTATATTVEEQDERESDDSIGSASDLRANDDFMEGDEVDNGQRVAPGKPGTRRFNRGAFGDGSVDDCISESIKTCGSSAYHAECESVTTNEDNSSRIVTRVRVKKREHDSKHSVIDEDDSGEEDMLHGDKPLLLDDELDYESAPENNNSGEDVVLMDPFTPESLPDESEKQAEEDEVDLDPFALAPFRKPTVPKRNSIIKYMPNVVPIPENCPTVSLPPSLPLPLPTSADNFCTSTPVKPIRRSLPEATVIPLRPLNSDIVPLSPPVPNSRTDLFGSEPFPAMVLTAPKPLVEPTPIPTVSIEPGSVALTHIIPSAISKPLILPEPPTPPAAPAFKQPLLSTPMTARLSYINFGQIPGQTSSTGAVTSISPDNNYVNFAPDGDDDDARKLKSDDYDSSDTVVKSSSKAVSGGSGVGFLSGKKDKVRYNSLKEKLSSSGGGGSKDDSASVTSSTTSTGNHVLVIPSKLSSKVKVNVSGYKKVSSKLGKKDKSVGNGATESEQRQTAKVSKKMGFSNMSFEDFPSDDALEEHQSASGPRHGGSSMGGKLLKIAPFEVIRNEKMLLEAEKKFGSLKRRSNPFS